MTREEAEKKAYERYPDDFGPCDKPSIYDDARTLRIQRDAYIAGLLNGSSEKPNNHEGLDEAAGKFAAEEVYPGDNAYENAIKCYKAGWLTRDVQIPKLPDNVDEAANISAEKEHPYRSKCGDWYDEEKVDDARECHQIGFKAGAEWAFGQGVIGEVKDFFCVRVMDYASAKIAFATIPELKYGDKVIVQIRK